MMKNPWKRSSKINPQKEDGFRQINTCVLEALIKAKLTTAEMSIVLTIISKTWGFNKKSDAISISQFSKATSFTNRAIQKANKKLTEKRIIVIESSERVNRGSPLNEYMLNKHYDTWIIQDKKRVNAGTGGEPAGRKRVNAGTPTIYNSTIDKPDFANQGKKPSEIYLTKKGKHLVGDELFWFNTFWDCFNYKKGKADAADSWLEVQNLTQDKARQICRSAKQEAKNRKNLKNGQTPKWAQGWLTGRRWEDESLKVRKEKIIYAGVMQND